VAEASKFAAGLEAGKPAEGYVTFKVSFVVR
jgi:hypothetical protein